MEDVFCVVNKMKIRFRIKEIILWGRSMGAATALLYAAKYEGVKAVITDNAFSDL
jgi:pimeloyl-ACP methyl ester carboxylesterase